MADRKLNDLALIPSIGRLKNIYVEDVDGNQYRLSKENLAEVLGGLIGVATTEKNGLATAEMAKNVGMSLAVNGGTYWRFTRLTYSSKSSIVEIIVAYSPAWSIENSINLIVALNSDNGSLQGVVATGITGNRNNVSLYNDSEGYLYITHNYQYLSTILIRLNGENILLYDTTSTPPELTKIPIS